MQTGISVVFKDLNCLLPDAEGHVRPIPNKKWAKVMEDLGGNFARSKVRRLIAELVASLDPDIFIHPPRMLPGGTTGYLVTVDMKRPREVPIAKDFRPFEVLHHKGHITTMLIRPDPKKAAGVIFKLCPEGNEWREKDIKRQVGAHNLNSPDRPIPLASSKQYHPLNAQTAAA